MKNPIPSPPLIAFISLAFSLSADTYYVSTEGNTENDGSREKPWPTVEHALAQVGGGKTILVRPGTYRGPIHIARAHAGTAERPTVIQSEVISFTARSAPGGSSLPVQKAEGGIAS
jgi:hypothetical protein